MSDLKKDGKDDVNCFCFFWKRWLLWLWPIKDKQIAFIDLQLK